MNTSLDKLKKQSCCIINDADNYFIKNDKKFSKLINALNEKKYHVKNSGMSSRIINYLGKEDLLDCNREKALSWRKFSFKELIYLGVINELRQYGFKNKQLMSVKDTFFKQTSNNNTDAVLIYVLRAKPIYLIVDTTGFATFFNEIGMELLVKKRYQSYVNVTINEIYNNIRKNAGLNKTDYKNFIDILSDVSINRKESEIIKIIRNKKYRKITIKKIKEQKYVINAESVKESQEKEILTMLKDGDYFDIDIKKRDGKVVSIRKKDAFKI